MNNKRKLTIWPGLAFLGLMIFTLFLAPHSAEAEEKHIEESRPGPVAILTADDVDAFTFIPPAFSPQPGENQPLALTFNITYVGVPAEAQAAFNYAANVWSSLLTSSQTINVTLTWTALPGTILGSAGAATFYANFPGAPLANTWYPVALAEMLSGADRNTAGSADINAQFDSDSTPWYFGTDGNPGSGEYDFVSVAMHELGHGLGFSGSMRYDNGSGTAECAGVAGQGCWGLGGPGYPIIYDRFTEDNGGTAMLNTGTYPNPSAALGSALTSNNVYFDAPNANTANDGSRVQLYAPGTWTGGSSYSHLNESSYPAGDFNSLMTPQLASAEAIHDPGQITLCLFADMGWDAYCNPVAVWNGSGATNDWSEADNWDTDLVPIGPTEVTFNATSTKDALIDGSFGGSIASLTVGGSYTGTITQTDAITITGSFLQSGGLYTATAGTLTFNGGSGDWSTTAASNFGDVQIGDGTSAQAVTLMSDVSIQGDLTIRDGGQLNGGSQTIHLGGDWLEEGFGFNPGTSTVILDGSSQTVDKPITEATVLDEDFSFRDGSGCSFNTAPPTGWANLLGPSGHVNGVWYFGDCAIAPNSPNSAGHGRRWFTAPGGSVLNAWIISPETILFPQATYTLTYNYGVSSAADPSDFAAYYGNAQNIAAMTTEIFSDTGAVNTTWTTAVVSFTVGSTGSYYFGFQNYDPSSSGEDGAIDDILLVGRSPLAFYNLTVEGGTTTFSTDVVVANNLTINAGAEVDFGGNEATVDGTFANDGVMNQTLDVPGSATTRFFHITDADGAADNYYGVDITPDASMGSTTVTLQGNQANCSTNPADALIGRCFDITPTTAANASIRFWFTEAERNGRDASALVVWHHNGTDWEPAGDTPTHSEGGPTCASGGGLACWVQVENVSSYSPFVPGENLVPTAINLQSAGIRHQWQNWPLWAAAVGLLFLSGLLLRRREKQARVR